MDKKKKTQYDVAYAKAKLKRIPLDVALAKYDEIKEAASIADLSVNGFIKNSIELYMKSGTGATVYVVHIKSSVKDLASIVGVYTSIEKAEETVKIYEKEIQERDGLQPGVDFSVEIEETFLQ